MGYDLQGTQIAPNEVEVFASGDETPDEYYEEYPFRGFFNRVHCLLESFRINDIGALLLLWQVDETLLFVGDNFDFAVWYWELFP